jgi:hypothetical protein
VHEVPTSFVDLLKESEVDITKTSLDSFGMDGEEVEDADGENDL